MPLKFVRGNDNVFQLLGDLTPYRASTPRPRWGTTRPPRLCSSKISFKTPGTARPERSSVVLNVNKQQVCVYMQPFLR